jgi:uncharacterized protein (DUF58 family)
MSIVQDVSKARGEALRFISLESVPGLKPQSFIGEGTEFENLLDFAPGMDNRFIDWKHSARHRRLLAKEFRQERNQHIILGFDTGRLMLEPVGNDTRLDHFIRAALSLSWISLRSGDLVGSCTFDALFRSFLPPGRTPSFFRRIQKFTADIQYCPLETNFTLSLTELASHLRQRSLVILFTEFSDSAAATLLIECLELLVKKHAVIFVATPDPVSSSIPGIKPASFTNMAEALIAEKFNRERAIILERMARLGVHAIDVFGPSLSSSLINRYLALKKRAFF